MALGLAAVTTISGAFVYSYFYLRLGADRWPIDGGDPAPLTGPLLAAAGVVAAVAIAPGLRRGATAGAVSMLLAAGAVVVQIASLAASDAEIDADAYGSLVVTLEAWSAIVLVSAIVVRASALVLRRTGPSASSIRDADAAWFPGALVLWLVLWSVVHLAPRVI